MNAHPRENGRPGRAALAPLRIIGLVMAFLLLPTGLTACNERTTKMEAQTDSSAEAAPVTNRTSREIFDGFMAASDEAIKATGAPDEWTFVNGAPWSSTYEEPIVPILCRPEDRTGPRHMTQQLLGPPSDDPGRDREQMRRYFEDEGMTIIAEFQPEPGDPPQVTWTVTAEGKDGAVIKFWANSLGRSLNVTSECSSHPSMKEEVSPTVP